MIPPKARKFLNMLHEKLYRNEPDDNFLVFEESDFRKAWFTVAEIDELIDFLKRKKVVVRERDYEVWYDTLLLPITPEDKAGLLKWSWRELFVTGKTKTRYAMEISREAFYGMYNGPSRSFERKVLPTAPPRIAPRFDLAKGKIYMGDKDCKIPMNSNQYILCQNYSPFRSDIRCRV